MLRRASRRKTTQRKVIVIGSGMAGLTAATYLARAGHAVTLYEQYHDIGGVTATVTQDGFGWDLGPVLLEGFGPHECGGIVLKELEIADRVPLKAGDRGYVFPDFDLRKPPIYTGPNWRRERLEQLFPAERESIDRYYRYHRQMLGLAAARATAHTARGAYQLLHRSQLWLAHRGTNERKGWSAQRLLDDFFVDRRLRAVFSSGLTRLSVEPSRFSASDIPSLNVDHSFDERSLRGPSSLSSRFLGGKRPSYHYILGGCGLLVQAVADRLREAGGKIHTGVLVDKIVIDRDRVKGVQLSSGHYESADVVIATGGSRETFFHLVGREYLPSGLAYQIDIETPMESVMMVHLGIDFDPRPWQPDPLCIYHNTYDIEGSIDACRRGDYHEGYDGFLIYIPTLHSPELAPAGHHAVTIYTLAPNELGAAGQRVADRTHITESPSSWRRRRRELTRTLIARAETVIPDLSAHTRTQLVLTPPDFRTLTHQVHHASGGRAPVMGHQGPGYETPIHGLWFIGSQSKSGGGVQPVMTGAREAAHEILGRGH
jgi:all-trans-retinol 13,14-reductase